MKIPVWFKVLREDPNVPLDFEIVCAEHCGARHYAMKGRVVVQSPEEYASFLRRKFKEQSATVDPQVANAAGGAQ